MTLEIRNNQLIWRGEVIADLDLKQTQYKINDAEKYLDESNNAYDAMGALDSQSMEEYTKDIRREGYVAGVEETKTYIEAILKHSLEKLYTDKVFMLDLVKTISEGMSNPDTTDIVMATYKDILEDFITQELDPLDFGEVEMGPGYELEQRNERNERMQRQKQKLAEVKKPEPVKPEPVKPEPVKPEPVKAKPTKKPKAKPVKRSQYPEIDFFVTSQKGEQYTKKGRKFTHVVDGVRYTFVLSRTKPGRPYWGISHYESGLLIDHLLLMPKGTRKVTDQIAFARTAINDRVARIKDVNQFHEKVGEAEKIN